MPVEVRDGLLKTHQVVNGASDNVDSGSVAGLGSEVVLEGKVVPLTK